MEPHDRNEQMRRDLVATYRRERMPEDRRAAAWARLQAEIGGEAPEVSPRRLHGRRDLWWGVALAAAAALVLIFGARGRTSSREPGDRANQAAHEAKSGGAQARVRAGAGDATGAPSDQAAPAAEASGGASTEAAAQPRRPRPQTQDAPKDMPDLDAELALLRAAREALGRGAPAEALASLEQHARRFPSGHLVEERMLLRAQAQCALGRREEARASAAALMEKFPGSPHAGTVAGLCEG